MDDRKNIESRIEELTIRYLEDRISSSELTELKSLLEDSRENFQLFQQINLTWQKTGLDLIKKFDVEEDWNYVSKIINGNNKRNIFLRLGGYAAIFIIALSIGGFFLFRDKPETEIIQYTSNDVKVKLFRGENRLDVASGTKIDTILNKLIDKEEVVESKQEQLFTLITFRGGDYHFTLSDGSKVWLNAESELRFPEEFNDSIREIYLKGEAYFDIARDEQKPFKVHIDEGYITVLGTEFNVSNYTHEDIHTTVAEGIVMVKNNNLQYQILKKGEQATIYEEDVTKQDVDVYLYTSWKDGYFVYREEPLDDILRKLSRWYDFTYIYMDDKSAKEVFTARIGRYEDLETILNYLESIGYVEFNINGKNVTVKTNNK